MSSVVERIVEAGGFATRAALVAATSRSEVDAALRSGEIVADGRGRYATPATDEAVRAAHALSGVMCLRSAALHHGWEVLVLPGAPEVAVPRTRKVAPHRREGIDVYWTDLDPAEVVGDIATDVEATLRMCMSRLPRREGLAIADSALRAGVPHATVQRAALSATGPGAPRARWIAARANGDAANPFESALRDITYDVPGLPVTPQVWLRGPRIAARPDLVDRDLGVVLEADSWQWHGGRQQLAKDARRYNLLVIDGWIVLRFAYEDVLGDADDVREVLVAVVALVDRHARCRHCGELSA